ncbi:ABC transporter B family member 19-like [Cryptomeria japonica]|uniref:ABC transporter B family member 19-like n=1 Tax=Cryptomeria japonica TaxID=3369 RepID=UPI0027DA69DA|nr:ABC transporter B family member 19-like [Cryptomeria japonica]
MEGVSDRKVSPKRDEKEIKITSPKRDAKEIKKAMRENPRALSLPLYSIFSFADALDCLLILVGTIGAVGTGLVLPIYSLFFSRVVNQIGLNTNTVSQYALYIVYLAIAAFAVAWAEISCWMYTAERQTTKMRYKYLEAILKQDVAVFDTQIRTGAILDSFSTDFLLIQESLGDQMASFVSHLATVLAGFAFSLSYEWTVALVVLAIVPLVVAIGALNASLLSKVTYKGQRAQGLAATIAEEVLSQIRTVYSYVGESKAMESYSKKLKTTVGLGYQEGLVKGVGEGTVKGILYASWGMLCWYAGILLRKGISNVGDTLSSIFNMLLGVVAIGYVLSSLTFIVKGGAAYNKIMEIINQTPILKDNLIDGPETDRLEGIIEFKNVDFSYPSRPDAIVLQNLNLLIPARKTLALVGGSGSGKSTIISLLERFYEPTQGQILVDGLDIKGLKTLWLRQQIGLVSQEPVLFSTSIKENILYGKEDANEEEVMAAAKASNAHDFITNFPERYETKVGEKGLQLSGGQKQRIALARAIVKSPKILLLDEATSALDSVSERLVQLALDELMIGRTTVVIAHRLSTIKNIDTIAVIKDGCIVEMGSHDQLMAKQDGGAYFSLVNLQAPDYSNHDTEETVQVIPNPSSEKQDRSLEAQIYESNEGENKTVPKMASEIMTSKGSTWRLLKMSAADWPYAIMGMVGSIMLGCLNPLLGLFMAKSMAIFFIKNHSEMERKIGTNSMAFIGIALAILLGSALQQSCLGVIGANLSKQVREKMLAAILRNEIAWFDRDENGSLQISSRISSDGTHIKTVIQEMFIISQYLTSIVTSIIICFTAQWQFSLVLLATYPILGAGNIAQKMSQKGLGGDQAKAHNEATVVAGEAVSNIRTLIAFNAEKKVLSLFQNLLSKPVRRSFRKGQIAGLIYGLSQMGLYCSYALALWNASRLVRNGTATFSQVIVAYMVLILASYTLSETMALAPNVVKSTQAVKSIFKILDRQTQMEPEDPQALNVQHLKGDIEFRKVRFCYPNRPQVTVFENLDLKLEAGRSLALVGSSGCGKSSIIALIERFYDPTEGTVLIDDMDVRTYHLRSLRLNISLVQQEPALFATSIRDNIVYGKENATEEEVTNAARIANAHEFISKLPDGYGTLVGERGVEMSGGQKQRLAIARAILKNPAILLLDEATSGLDAESERVVQEALERVMEGRTSIVVAHRLSTIKNVTTIAVVKDGRIAEQGSHSELMAAPHGEYSRLHNIKGSHQPTSIEQ